MIEFRQQRSLRYPDRYIEQWHVVLDGTLWGIFHEYIDCYLLHRGAIPFQFPPKEFNGPAFAEAAKEAGCEDYIITKE